MKRISWLALGFLLLAPLAARANEKVVDIGDTSILLPVMPGFQELYGKNSDFDQLMEHFVPPTNKLLAVYVSDADIAEMNKHPDAGLQRYILVQTTAEDVKIGSPADFDAVKQEFAKQAGAGDWQQDKGVNDAMDRASGYLKDKYDKEAQLKIGDTRALGKIVDTPDAIAVLMLTNYGVTTPKGTESHPMAAGLGVENIKSRALMIFAYTNYNGDADADFISGTEKKFFEATASLNGDGEASSASGGNEGPDVDVGGAMGWATKGAILIVLLAAAALLIPKIMRLIGKRDEIR
jgi:hypothetical protein